MKNRLVILVENKCVHQDLVRFFHLTDNDFCYKDVFVCECITVFTVVYVSVTLQYLEEKETRHISPPCKYKSLLR